MNQSTPATPRSEPDVDRSAPLNPSEIFPFPLDDFQLEAMDALNQGHSVVVSAPTGSGKTLIGEYAIHRALAHGQKVFYTTPLKALEQHLASTTDAPPLFTWICDLLVARRISRGLAARLLFELHNGDST